MGGPVCVFGWISLVVVIVMGCIMLCMSPRRDRRVPLVDVYAACLHIQLLFFILCVPLSRAAAAYISLESYPGAVTCDSLISAASVLLDFTVGGVFLASVSLRHRTVPTLEWLPVVSVIISIISLFAVWVLRMAACIPLK